MQTTTMTSKSGCGCGSVKSAVKAASCGCGCGGKGCSACAAPPEAYARPQFFSGQLLTEDDLQSLGDYVVAKNRLHNRMLFGSGVACGLKVTLDECDKLNRHLVVRPGYALDCCGNDIVVPCEAHLDVVQLVRDLRTRMLGKDCGDPCVEIDEKTGKEKTSYCLYLVYCEQESDPVAPYDGEDTCGGGDCRNTRVREGYRFELRCCTPSPCKRRKIEPGGGVYTTSTAKAGAVYDRLLDARNNWSAASRDAVVDSLESTLRETRAAYEPNVMNLLQEARTTEINGAGRTRVTNIVALLLVGWLREIDCDAMLPDCPTCDEDGVLIACFDWEDCAVSNLCCHRRLQILSPAYFAQLGLTHTWRCLLMAACCGSKPDDNTIHSGGPLGNIHGALTLRSLSRVSGEEAEDSPSIDELEAFLKARFERIDDASAPEYRATLLPELARGFGMTVAHEETEAEVRERDLQRQIDALRGELDKLKDAMTGAKPKGKKGDNS